VKHTWQITAVLLGMFLITQLIGLLVLKADIFHIQVEVNGTLQNVSNPQLYWIAPPENVKPGISISSLIVSFIIAIALVFILSKIKAKLFLRAWFFLVIVIAIFLSIYAFEKLVPWVIPSNIAIIIPLIISLTLAFFKVVKRNMLVHNLSELLVYPGIATIFVSFLFYPPAPYLSIIAIIFILLLISLYDIYAVWHSGFMQKMAKFQINELKFFAGFFVPYLSKKEREKIKLVKQKYKKKEIPQKILNKQKIKVNLAILGGGDVVFPIIAAGIFLEIFGLVPALFVTLGATLALLFLFTVARKGKFYPAMPFLSAGIFVGMLVGWLVSLI